MSFLIFIQFSLSIVLLYYSISNKNNVSRSLNKLNNSFKNQSSIILISSKNPMDAVNINGMDKYKRFDEYLNNNKDFKHIVIYDNAVSLKIFDGINKFSNITNVIQKSNDSFMPVNSITLEKLALDYIKTKVSMGRTFAQTDFNTSSDIIPVLMGYDYTKYFKLNDEIEYLDFQKIKKIKVVGFLEQNSYCVMPDNPGTILGLNNYIIIPYKNPQLNFSTLKDDEKVYSLYRDCYKSIILSNSSSENQISSIKESITNKAKELDIKLNIKTAKDKSDDYQNEMKNANKSNIMLFVVIFLFSSVGFVSSILYSINIRMKEFGVHLMAGARIKDIIIRVVLEILIIMFLSCTAAFSYLYFVHNHSFNLNSILECVVCVCVLCAVLCIVPVIKISKISINNLVRGNE